MTISGPRLQTALLKVLANPGTDKRLGRGREYLIPALVEEVRSASPGAELPFRHAMAAVWSLVSQGLAYIDFSQSVPENWQLLLTDAGIAAAQDEAINPNNPGQYLERLKVMTPHVSDIVRQYAREAVISYNSQCYLASTVVLGVASEAAFLEMARAFGSWLSSEQGDRLLQIIENPRTSYINKFSEFRKRIEPQKPNMPQELSDGMSVTLDAVLDVLRTNRNDIGHPTGKQVARDDVAIYLGIFPRYLQKLYALKEFFETPSLSS
jgi:hypothetical protein